MTIIDFNKATYSLSLTTRVMATYPLSKAAFTFNLSHFLIGLRHEKEAIGEQEVEAFYSKSTSQAKCSSITYLNNKNLMHNFLFVLKRLSVLLLQI